MQRPLDIATKITADFISFHAGPSASILEIGCGDGDLALELQEKGHRVIAIDSDGDAVARARGKSVNAFEGHWPDFASEQMDIVAFTRSLHHVHNLPGAIDAARARLRPDGLLLVEDFAFDRVDERTCVWFAGQLKSAPVQSLLNAPPDSFVAKVLSADNPQDAWHSDHDHDLHSIEAMAEAIESEFDYKSVVATPYLFRYLIPALPETPAAAEFLLAFAKNEDRMIKSREIAPIGRRVVAGQNSGD